MKLLAAITALALPVVGCQDAGDFETTCYALTGTTASGAPAGHGRVAADTQVLPMGTRLWIEGYGAATVADRGPAIQGRRIDVWLSTAAACRQWGRRQVRVVVIAGG